MFIVNQENNPTLLLFVDTNIAYNLKKNNYIIQYSYMRNNIFFIIH